MDFYIEKDVIRRIKLVEFIYSHNHCLVDEILNELKISLQTLKNDFKRVNIDIEEFILTSHINSKEISITFKTNIPLLQITQKLYNESKFVRSLYRALHTSDLTIAELREAEFISESNAFRILSNVKLYLTEHDILKNEVRYRMLVNATYARIDFADEYIDQFLWHKAKIILENIIDKRTVHFNDFDAKIVIMNIYLALSRNEEHPLQISLRQFAFLLEDPTYPKLKREYEKEMSKEKAEIEAVLTTLVYHQFANYKDYTVSQPFQKTHWNALTAQHNQVYALYIQLITLSSRTIIDESSFQRQFERVLFNGWVGINLFTPHFLIDSHSFNYQQFRQVILRWNAENPIALNLQENSIKGFYYLYKNILATHDNYYVCNIVATNQDQFTFIFNFFFKYISSAQFKINSTIYYTLDELPEEYFNYPYIIICDHSLYKENYKNAKNLFPFAVDTIRQDTQRLIDSIFEDVNSLKTTMDKDYLS
ncbi:hypothetical protein [Catellicoccus marimammalium]|uniref:Mga helix-turn-helix domain-containing protein n=1 Tax=Catellicoccus marimammalium M35/04/3 TaxID=1234409 RepID=K8ZB49_9ENTE|nr:hypothetical protein [Catellicoccus marimammalium]EKU27272.1 hypothetical protein C683_0603 [Catellicoccus marimammalium M35/04/3]